MNKSAQDQQVVLVISVTYKILIIGLIHNYSFTLTVKLQCSNPVLVCVCVCVCGGGVCFSMLSDWHNCI
jgi:hypothetical protein